MKAIIILLGLIIFCPLAVRADTQQPTAFEKALYDKARYQVLGRLSDDDFVSYCTTMNCGGDTLIKLHDEILARQAETAGLLKQGFAETDPKIIALENMLRDLKSQFAVKIGEARRGLEIESRVAEATLANLSQYQK